MSAPEPPPPAPEPSAPWTQRAQARLERHGPFLGGILGAGLVIAYGADLQNLAASREWELKEVYGAMFNLSAILCGALGTLYGLLVASTTPFIDKIRSTKSFQRYLGYVRSAIGLSFASALYAIPILVTKPVLGGPSEMGTIGIAGWVGVVIAMLVAFVRIVPPAPSLFEVRPPPRIPGG